MASGKVFAPSNMLAPGVRVTEKDFSFIVSAPTANSVGLVGFATKGPLNVPTLVTSLKELHDTFGNAHPELVDPYLIYAAEQVIQQSTSVYIVRCGETSPADIDFAETAEVEVGVAGGAVEIIGNVTGPYVFSEDQFFRWRLNGILASKVLVILANTISNPNYSIAQIVEALNDQLSDDDGILFYVATGNLLGCKSTFSYGTASSIEMVSVQSSLYGPSSVVGVGTGMTAGSVVGIHDKYPNNSYVTAGSYDFTGLSNVTLQVVVDGSDNVNVDRVIQIVTMPTGVNTISDVVDHINQLIDDAEIPGGFVASAVSNNLKLATTHYGRDAKITVKSASTAGGIFGIGGLSGTGTSPTRTSGGSGVYAGGIVTGSADTSGDASFTVTAESPGTEGNFTEVRVISDVRTGQFALSVFNNDVQVETWGPLTKDSSKANYVESYIALNSLFIRVVDNTDVAASPLEGTYALSGGTNGVPSDPDDQDLLLIGTSTAKTGIYALSDPDQSNINLVAVPGRSSTDVVVAILDVCQNKRADCFAIIDPPFGLSVDEVIDWQAGVHPLNLVKFDSDFGALYWPWLKVRDSFNKIDVWVPPSGPVLATYVYSDSIARPWFPPAGEVRGIVFNVLDVYTRPSSDQKDSMYQLGNCINAIVNYADSANFIINGQKTLQRRPSALDRVSVRRMLLAAEKEIRRKTRPLLYEPHDEILRTQFVNICKEILQRIQVERGIYDFFVKCDEELNPPVVVERNELRAKIGVQPTRANEFTFIEFSVHRIGTFNETTVDQF
jgi:phage tail sheath protein FI